VQFTRCTGRIDPAEWQPTPKKGALLDDAEREATIMGPRFFEVMRKPVDGRFQLAGQAGKRSLICRAQRVKPAAHLLLSNRFLDFLGNSDLDVIGLKFEAGTFDVIVDNDIRLGAPLSGSQKAITLLRRALDRQSQTTLGKYPVYT
jgi:hypothetical protein